MSGPELLSVAQMRAADAAAIAGGVPAASLMAAAGRAVAQAAARHAAGRPITVLAGPGDNGGDGYAAAAQLLAEGAAVRVLALPGGPPSPATATMRGLVPPAAIADLDGRSLESGAVAAGVLVVDALFGAGLSRPVEGVARAALERVAALGLPVNAVDVPSGVDGDTGLVRGVVAPALETVTFFRAKPGHLLPPGRGLCGRLTVAPIGIEAAVLSGLGVATWHTGPDLVAATRRAPSAQTHKYTRGHLGVLAGPEMWGAALLAALAGLRVGAGLVTLLAPPACAAFVRTAADPSLIVRGVPDADLPAATASLRLQARLVGPGLGRAPGAAERALSALAGPAPAIVDGDALSLFQDDPARLFAALPPGSVLTPHEGEFRRLFSDLDPGRVGRLAAARRAAARAGAVVLLKGAETVVAAPDGGAWINTESVPDLATAGSGDVLAGLIGGLLAQSAEAGPAAASAAWLHGRAGRAVGPGLIASDLVAEIPRRLRSLPGRGARPPVTFASSRPD